MREQIIFKSDLSPALSRGRLSHWVCGVGGRPSGSRHLYTWPPVWLGGTLFTDLGSSQTVFQVYSHWGLGKHLGWGGSCLGACTCWSLWVPLPSPAAPLSDHVELAVLQLPARGRTCTLHLFRGLRGSPEPRHKLIWGLLTLSPELMQVLWWDFFQGPSFPLHHSKRQGRG